MTDININTSLGFAGKYKFKVIDSSGVVKHETDWIDNLITNAGLDQIFLGSPGYSSSYLLIPSCFVGTGTTAPAYTDTHLTSYLATSPGLPGTFNHIYVAGPPSYWTQTWGYTFPAGTATGILSEVGVGFQTNPTGPVYTLFSHALIVDSGGSPTTITVLSTDQLVVYYQLNVYMDTTTNTGSINISGVTYATTWLPSNINTAPVMSNSISSSSISNYRLYSGGLGTITGGPTGSNIINTSGSFSTYYAGDYYTTISVIWDTTTAAISGNAFTFYQLSFFQHQIGYSPVIPKTTYNTLTLNTNLSWARYP